MTVKDQLLSELRNLPLDREAARTMQEDLASIEAALQKKGLPADRREALLTEQARLRACLEATAALICRTERRLSMLTPEEQLVLQRLVIQPSKAAYLSLIEELHCEASSVYRIRARAVNKLIRLRYGAGAASVSEGGDPCDTERPGNQ